MHLFQKKQDGTAVAAPQKKKKKIVLVVILVIVIVIGVIAGALKKMTAQVESVANTVEIEPVEKRDLSDSISLKGTIAGESKTNVMSIAAAEITAVDVQVGDLVTEGDPLVTLDQEDIEKQIAELETSVRNADALAANDAKLKQENLSEAKQDQASALSKASGEIGKAQAGYDELVAKRDKCQNSITTKKNDLNNTAAAREDAKSQAADARNAAQSARAQADANPQDKQLADAASEAESNYAQKQDLYTQLAAKCDSLTAEITGLEAELDTYADSLKSAQEAIETAKTGYSDTQTSTNRSIASAQNNVDMQKYQTSGTSDQKDQLEELKKQLTDCTLYAPCSGVVTAVNVSVGDKNTAGQTMITIENTGVLKVVVSVDESDILKIQEGMKATVTTDATGDEEINGTVTRVVRVKNQSANASDTNTASGYSAEITIDRTDLLVGMSAKAKIVIQDRGSMLAVPYDLIQTDENGNSYVFVAKDNGDGTATAVKKNVETGEEVDYYTEVTGGDLKEGDLLIYDYTYTMTEGTVFTPDQSYANQSLDGTGADGSMEAE